MTVQIAAGSIASRARSKMAIHQCRTAHQLIGQAYGPSGLAQVAMHYHVYFPDTWACGNLLARDRISLRAKEVVMRTFAILLLMLSAAATMSFAQGTATPPRDAPERPAAAPKGSGHPDHPQKEYGATGWTGGNRGSGSVTTGDNSSSDSAAQQPEMATGADLGGPPKRFKPAETPE